MKQRFFFGLVCTTVLVMGCSSQPTRVGQIRSTSGPEILLPNGKVEQAQLLAMGMAQSKGWTIVEADDQRLLLERQLPEGSPQAQMLSPEGVQSTPKLQIETRLQERGEDVLVHLNSSVIINPGTEQERTIDYTKDYQDQLMISLNALASAWLENRTRIASEIPLPPNPDEIAIAEAGGSDTTDEPTTGAIGPPLDTPAEASADVSTMTAAAAPPLAPPSATPSAPASPDAQWQGSEATTPQLSTNRAVTPSGADQAEQDLTAPRGPVEANPMMVLDGQARRGLWTFYAEASARERGCTVTERGAVLLSTTTAFELYEVQCGGGSNLLLRCQGGVCREIN